MLFSVSGIEVSPWVPPLVAFVISVFTSMGGISGAFLILPFQVSVLGFTSPAVSATNQLYNIVAIPSGVYRYIKEGRMAWPLAWIIIIGTLPGVFLGAILRIRYLLDPKHFKLFAGLVLFYIGIKLIRDLVSSNKADKKQTQVEEKFKEQVEANQQKNRGNQTLGRETASRVVVNQFSLTRIVYEFQSQTFDINALSLMALSFIIGIVGGIYGIGGGAIIAPFLVTLFKLPIYTVAGATLMGTFVTSIAGVAIYQTLSVFFTHTPAAPDWALGFLFGIGGFAGMYCGARIQKFVRANVIKWILVFCIVFPAAQYVWQFFR